MMVIGVLSAGSAAATMAPLVDAASGFSRTRRRDSTIGVMVAAVFCTVRIDRLCRAPTVRMVPVPTTYSGTEVQTYATTPARCDSSAVYWVSVRPLSSLVTSTGAP